MEGGGEKTMGKRRWNGSGGVVEIVRRKEALMLMSSFDHFYLGCEKEGETRCAIVVLGAGEELVEGGSCCSEWLWSLKYFGVRFCIWDPPVLYDD